MNNRDDDNLPDTVRKCLDILDDNLEILTDLEQELDDEKANELTPKMKLYQLYDMTEDVSVSAKLKRAENSLMQRQLKDSDLPSS